MFLVSTSEIELNVNEVQSLTRTCKHKDMDNICDMTLVTTHEFLCSHWCSSTGHLHLRLLVLMHRSPRDQKVIDKCFYAGIG